MAYLSIINANDYRKNIMTEEMAGIGVNLYRGYENKYSGSEYLKNARLPDLHKYVMGMSYEQFKYENPEWVYQNFNRNYHILIGSLSINRDGLVDANMITKEIFEFTVEETLALEWAVLWLCYNCPFPLSLPEKVYRKKDERILTKNNIERIIDYYSVTYEQVRKSPLGKQIFYSKPFVITQKKREKLAVSIYLVQMMLADGLYWLIRDFLIKYDYKKDTEYCSPTIASLMWISEEERKISLKMYIDNDNIWVQIVLWGMILANICMLEEVFEDEMKIDSGLSVEM